MPDKTSCNLSFLIASSLSEKKSVTFVISLDMATYLAVDIFFCVFWQDLTFLKGSTTFVYGLHGF